jgi:predicted nucleic acid-binding protein
MNLVLDSSVIAKLFVEEEDSDLAVELFKQISIKGKFWGSDPIFYEVGNTILKHLPEKSEKGPELVKQLFFLDIDYSILDRFLAIKAFEIAKTYNITYYDAVHIAVSQHCQSPLVTEDKELLKKFKHAISMSEAIERIEKESRITDTEKSDEDVK